MTPPVLLDASALIAFLRRESGFEVVRDTLLQENCLVCAVQLVEVKGKLVSDGNQTASAVQAELDRLAHVLGVVAFDAAAQEAASFYYARRRPYNLSLGDALCLGLAEHLGATVLTAERTWADIPDLPVTVKLIRP